MAVIDAREDPAWQTAIAMGAGGQSKMGQEFMAADQGRPGQGRVSGKGGQQGQQQQQPSSPMMTELIKMFSKKKKKKNLAALSTARGRTSMGY